MFHGKGLGAQVLIADSMAKQSKKKAGALADRFYRSASQSRRRDRRSLRRLLYWLKMVNQSSIICLAEVGGMKFYHKVEMNVSERSFMDCSLT